MGHEAINPSEVDAKIEAHRSNASAHHTKTTSSEIDHGSIQGLGDDDHTQYLTTGRHDTTARHPKTVIKTATGSASGTSDTQYAAFKINMHDYSFFPNIYAEAGAYGVYGSSTSSTDTVGRFMVYHTATGTHDYVIRWRYITASNNPQIWILRDAKGEVVAIWQADDPVHDDPFKEIPIQYFDKDGKPIGIPHYIEVPSFYDEFLATLKEGFSEVKKRYLVREQDVRPKRLPQNVVFGRLVKR